MANIKEKAKNFWEENKTYIIAIGGASIVTIGAGIIAHKSYANGFMDGGFVGANIMIDWLDKTFPGESNARELFERYAKEHPDEIVHRNI